MATNEPHESLEDEGIPELEEPINEDEGLIPPGDTPIAADEYGVTAAEQRTPEPMSERVTRELPDMMADDIDLDDADLRYGEPAEGDPIRGRLVQPGDEDVDEIDDEKDVVATLIGEDDAGMSAEEAALHIVDEP